MISVVAPNLNEERFLPTFLSSLVAQTFKDFEVVIVDGGSTDASLQIIDSFIDKLPIKLVIDTKRNLGYIRNVGASHTKGEIMLQCNTDNYLEPNLLEKINRYYMEHPTVLSLSGRVFPMGTSIIEHLAYQAFDFLRFIFTCAPMPIKKYRPSGSFMSIRTSIFHAVGGYPHATVNEDGLFGQKLDPYAKRNHKAVAFNLNLYVGHHVKKFRQMGGIHALLFYFYTLANLFPILKPLLEPIRRDAGLVFAGKSSTKPTVKVVLGSLWNWL